MFNVKVTHKIDNGERVCWQEPSRPHEHADIRKHQETVKYHSS